jgi:hypothetical protein
MPEPTSKSWKGFNFALPFNYPMLNDLPRP